jgi:AcrR family transcriptional regulator
VSADETRRLLVATAERLFAEGGVDGPSLREITRAAGQRNTAALQYHFGERDDLLQAVLDKHGRGIDAQRSALLDSAELDHSPSARALAAALVVPLVAKLDDADGGAEYLQIVGEMVMRPVRFKAPLAAVAGSPGMRRWTKLVESLLPPEAVGRPLHRRSAAFRFAHGELAGRARERSRRDHRLFTSHLVDLVQALLTAPVSDETRRLIRPA